MAQLADFVSVSQSSLYRSFQARFHVSPKHFILEYRIEKACILLTGSGYSVQEISNSVGFDDPLYFLPGLQAAQGDVPPGLCRTLWGAAGEKLNEKSISRGGKRVDRL